MKFCRLQSSFVGPIDLFYCFFVCLNCMNEWLLGVGEQILVLQLPYLNLIKFCTCSVNRNKTKKLLLKLFSYSDSCYLISTNRWRCCTLSARASVRPPGCLSFHSSLNDKRMNLRNFLIFKLIYVLAFTTEYCIQIMGIP